MTVHGTLWLLNQASLNRRNFEKTTQLTFLRRFHWSQKLYKLKTLIAWCGNTGPLLSWGWAYVCYERIKVITLASGWILFLLFYFFVFVSVLVCVIITASICELQLCVCNLLVLLLMLFNYTCAIYHCSYWYISVMRVIYQYFR